MVASTAIRRAARMRIIAVPLTSASRSHSRSSPNDQFVYYHFDIPPPDASKPINNLQKVVNKASDMWSGFGRAEEGSWKRRIFTWGEKLTDRVEYEELSLKTLDPSHGPKLVARRDKEPAQEEEKEDNFVPFIYPKTLASQPSALSHLQNLLAKRAPLHRRGFLFWMIVSPFTAPFMLIPVIPNLPFFFCVWRSWSHYKAYKSANYLQSLIDAKMITLEPSSELNDIYDRFAPRPHKPPGEGEGKQGTDSKEAEDEAVSGDGREAEKKEDVRLLINREAAPRITSLFSLPHIAVADMYRAMDQTAKRLSQ